MKNKKLVKKMIVLTATMLTFNSLSLTTLAGDNNVIVDNNGFRTATDTSEDFISWRSDIWDAGASADSGRIALTPGETEKDLNFAWYSESKGTPAVRVWKQGADMSTAKVYTGIATEISAENWQGMTYEASNKVTISEYFEENTKYYYQYTDDYKNGDTVWSVSEEYKVADVDKFSVILTGDPQTGASGSNTDKTPMDDSVARDTYNWNKTVEAAMNIAPNAAFLLSAGDQIDKSGASKLEDRKTRESEYAGYLYPSVFRSLPIASTIGNHDKDGIDYTMHFNNPNSEKNLGATAAGGDYYFSYGNVLVISLNSNNRNQEEHRAIMQEAVDSNKDAIWKLVIFHSDIYGAGQPHADTDAAQNRIIFAPLMDEFDIDVCLTGHDHTYSRSYQILDGNVINYDISDGSVTDPEGTMYITTGSGSGSKYYNFLNYTPYYIADRSNIDLPAFSVMDFTNNSLTIKTYDYNGNKYAEDFTINKSTEMISVDEAIERATKILEEIDETAYTRESVSVLKSSLYNLKEFKKKYTTEEDVMIGEIVNKYGTEEDRISGYGSVKNNEDKDVLATDEEGNPTRYANRFKEGLSSLLDKTIYTQLDAGIEIEDAILPIVNEAQLEEMKDNVISAIEGLKLVETPIENESEEEIGNNENESTNTNEKDEEESTNEENNTDAIVSPSTGDTTIVAGFLAVAMVAAGIVLMVNGKKEEDCEQM